MKTVYVALHTQNDDEGKVDSFATCLITVQETRKELEEYVMEFFGISDKRTYTEPSECLGFTKYEYSDFEDDLEGFYRFKDVDGTISRVYVYCKTLGEKIY